MNFQRCWKQVGSTFSSPPQPLLTAFPTVLSSFPGAQGVYFSFFGEENSWESSGEGIMVKRNCRHRAEGFRRSGVLQGRVCSGQGGWGDPGHASPGPPCTNPRISSSRH